MAQTQQRTDPIIGQSFGNVRALSILGRGGMGAVYLGYHAGLDMKVAIKILPDLFVGRSELVERFLREARLSGKLQHANIVRTLDVGQSNGMYYLVMEYVEGVDAARLLEREKRFSPMRAINIAGFVARALGEAHAQGILHRDIKPANILIARDGKVKVTDFGLARSLTNTATALTLSNQVVGTPNYMAPEQIRSVDVDFKVDIYALGVTLWQFLTGKLPFDGATPMAVLLNVVNEPLPMPDDFFRQFPRELRGAIAGMTNKDPRKRLGDIPSVMIALKGARDALRAAGMESTAPLAAGTGAASSIPDPVSGVVNVARQSQVHARVKPEQFTKPLGSDAALKPVRPALSPLPPRKPRA